MSDRVSRDGLILSTTFLVEPPLWCWEIRDAATDRPVEGSWTTEWMAYPSDDDARAAGEIRLAALVQARRAPAA
jgi:hypothetical protein